MPHLGLQAVLDELGRLAGLGSLPLDADGRLTLAFDGRLEVTLEHEPDEGRLILWALLAELGTERPLALLGELLDANFLWQGTGGATLSLERGSGKVVLSQALPTMGLEVTAMQRALEGFVTAAMHWSRHIVQGGSNEPNDSEVSGLHHFVRA